MHLDVVWMRHSFQRMSFVPRLSARLLATWLPLALRPWLLQPIARRRLAAVAAVFCRLSFQFLYTSLELVDDLSKVAYQLCHQRHHAFFTLLVSGVYLFAQGQFQRDHVPIVPGLYDFSNLKSSHGWLRSLTYQILNKQSKFRQHL